LGYTICIDFGNTSTKVSLNDAIFSLSTDEYIEINIKNILKKFDITHGLYSSVITLSDGLQDLLEKNNVLSIKSKYSNLPFSIDYQTIDTLGEDRIAASVGAYSLKKNKTFLTIQVGTAITYDYIIKKTYVGGAISLGFDIRYKALHNFTKKLPLLTSEDNKNIKTPMIGNNTNDSIHSGVYWGVIYELQARIDEFIKKYKGPVYLTTSHKENIYLKNCNFAEQNLVLLGLKYLLK
jgi:type III pantothenate kinase